jgi:O-antigen/teichoic acid export membrane protein
MHRGLATIYGLTQQIISTATTLIWAWFNPTLWAIVAGGVVSSLVSLVWSHFLLPGRGNRFHWDREAAHEIVRFGKWIFLSTAITFFAEQIDKIMLGKMFPLAVLGVYGVALTLADVPRSVTLALSGKIIFPALSKFTDLPRPELREKILRNRWPVLLAFAVLMTIPICWGDRIVMLLYRQPFWDAAWMLPILCLGIWPRVLCNTNESALFALGQSRYPAMAQMARFVFTAAGFAVGFHFAGLTGVVIAVAFNDLPFYLVINWALWKEGLNGLRQDLTYTLLLFALTAAMLGIRYAAGFGFPIDRLLH